MTPFASVAMLEKLALLKIALCRAPAFSSVSSACWHAVLLVPSETPILVLVSSFPLVIVLPPVTCTRPHLADRSRNLKITLRAVLQQSFGADIARTAYEGSVRLQQTELSFFRLWNCRSCRAHAISAAARWPDAQDRNRHGPKLSNRYR